MMLCKLERQKPSQQPESLLPDSNPDSPEAPIPAERIIFSGGQKDVKLWKHDPVAFGTPAIGLNAYATTHFFPNVSPGTEFPSDVSSSSKLDASDGDFERLVSRESELTSCSQLTLTSGAAQRRVSRGKRWFQKICAAMTPLSSSPSSERGRAGWLSRGRLSRSLSPRGSKQANHSQRPLYGGGRNSKPRARSALASRRGMGPMCVEVPARASM
eukprot:TRINITY_DN19939_c0_g1_i1.p1 TRINITY_DN19939_c0_g1~~TRINITY_DN19939_c0_g1_i1.p1  ORF type:complete len:214 (-),score=31.88 TRINITY_DN19939_c0_g1_i1:72-713(-)